MNCSKCGTPIRKEDLYCPNCKQFIRDDQLIQAIERMKSGDESAFSDIYDITYRYVYQRAKYMTNNESDTMDLVQEVYLALFHGIHGLNNSESLYSWLKTVTLRLGGKMIEKNQKGGILVEDETQVFDAIIDDDAEIEENYAYRQDLQFIKSCVSALSEEQRLVVLAYYYDNLKVDEIAELFNLSPGTVKSRLYLARKNIRSMISIQEEKQGYKFYEFGIPMLTTAISSVMEDIAATVPEQKELIRENLQHLFQSGSMNDFATEAASTTSEIGDMVQTSGETLIKTIIAAIMAKLAEIGAKRVAVSTVSIGIAAATAVTGYVTVNEDRAQYDNRAEQQVAWEETTNDPDPGPVQVQEEREPEPEAEAEPEPEPVTEVEEVFEDEETMQEEAREELGNPRANAEDYEESQPGYGQSGWLQYGQSSDIAHFTLDRNKTVTVLLMGTTITSNGIEMPIEGRYNLEIQDSTGAVVASTSGEMNGEDVMLSPDLPAGSYVVYLYNLATEMDLYDTLLYEMWLYQ